jgi:hypothetical protein
MTGRQLETPVALFIYKRPETTRRVFNVIRQVKPRRLLVVADGPRSHVPGEADACAAARVVVEHIDWQCEVLRNYVDINLGCRQRVSSGLSWVFNNVEEAIILEDDCLPHPSFFYFCEELLVRYRDDERIMAISGDNFQFGQIRTKYSYYFSRYFHCWGWATWRRAWMYYDVDMKLWPEARNSNLLEYILDNRSAVRYWTKIFNDTYLGRIDTWDYQWVFASWLQNTLTVLPAVNLVSNIGFTNQATHTSSSDKFVKIPAEAMEFPLHHPPYVVRHAEADRFTQRHIYERDLLEKLTVRARRFTSKLLALYNTR